MVEQNNIEQQEEMAGEENEENFEYEENAEGGENEEQVKE